MKILMAVISIFGIYQVIQFLQHLKRKNERRQRISNTKLYDFLHKNKFSNTFSFYLFRLKTFYHISYPWFSLFFFLIFSGLIALLVYITSYLYMGVISSACILAIFSFFIPFGIVEYLYERHQMEMMQIFPLYAISLKNYTRIHNDIIVAMRKAKVEKPLTFYIEKFNLAVERGMRVYQAFEMLKKDIGIQKITELLTALQNCYLYGGDFSKLLDTYSKMLTQINLQKEKQKEESFSAKLVLILLIGINLYLLFIFVLQDANYRAIVTGHLAGRIILNLNLLSYGIILYFVRKLNRMEA